MSTPTTTPSGLGWPEAGDGSDRTAPTAGEAGACGLGWPEGEEDR